MTSCRSFPFVFATAGVDQWAPRLELPTITTRNVFLFFLPVMSIEMSFPQVLCRRRQHPPPCAPHHIISSGSSVAKVPLSPSLLPSLPWLTVRLPVCVVRSEELGEGGNDVSRSIDGEGGDVEEK